MDSSKKVLICTPSIEFGGVANYYTCIRPFLSDNYTYLKIGLNDPSTFSITSLLKTIKNYFLMVKHNDYELAIVNPSVDIKSLIRDSILAIIAKYFKIKLIVFFRGYTKNTEKFLNLFPSFLYLILSKSDAVITLSSRRKNSLIKMGYNKKIFSETTTFSNKILNNNPINKKPHNNSFTILFMSRLIKGKGLYKTIVAFDLLKKKHNNIKLYLCGDGEEKNNLISLIANRSEIKYFGYVQGKEKIRIFSESDVFILPTGHGEGMPNAVLEAMACGLAVITRPAGGIKDFFINGKHGFITESISPTTFASFIDRLINDDKLINNIRLNNIFLAKNRFAPDVVADRINSIVNDTLIKH